MEADTNANLMYDIDAIVERNEAAADQSWWMGEEPLPHELRRMDAFLGEYDLDEVAPSGECIAEFDYFCPCDGCLAEFEAQQAAECAAEAANERALYGGDWLSY